MIRSNPFRSLLVLAAVVVFAAVPLLNSAQPVVAQEVGQPADQLLADAAQKMLEYDTMAFELIYESGSTKLFTGIKMTKAKGVLERPAKMKATVQTKVGFVKIDVKATVIGQDAWVKAVGIDEHYTLPDDLAHIIADPVLLLPGLASSIENPVVSSIEQTNEGDVIWVSGMFNPALIEDEAVRGYAESLGVRPVDVAIDDEGRIVSVRIAGQFVSQDSKDVVRRLDIFGFGIPVDIEAP